MRYESEVNIFNPSALNRKFSAIQTDFNVTLGKISAIISDSEIEQYQDGHTTMHDKLSATIQDLDGFHDQVSEMQTTYDGQFSSVNSRLTTFDETLEGITASVSTVSQEAIKADQIHYLATSASSGVTRETSGWTTTTQRITSTNRYLWIYHTYTKGDDSTEETTPVIAGVWGDTGLRGETGVSIAGVTNYYLASPLSSGVTRETSGWTVGIQTMTAQNQYLWNYEIVYGSDDTIISTSDPVIIGRYGQNGTNGSDGANGRGITSITEHYAVSSSNEVIPSRWYDAMVNTTSENRYLWNYETIAYTDGTTEDSTKRVIGTHGEKGDSPTVYEIQTTADAIVRNQAGTPSPTFVTFTCYRRIGNDEASTQSCYWSIEEYVDGAWVSIEAGGSAASSKTRYVSANATSVRATAYLNSTMSSASRLDKKDVPVISNGSDGYTVVLSNESHTFAGNVSSAVSGSTFSNIIAYKGTTRVAATIGTITGQPTGMTTSISYNGTTSARVNIEVSTAMTTKSGTLSIPVTIDGNTFALTFSYAIAFKGETGVDGINTATVYLYRLLTSTTTPAGPVNSTTYQFSTKTLSGNPGNSWSTELPSGNGTLWMAVATASSNTDTDTIDANEWAITKLARDGTNGTSGLDGYNKATVTLYRRSASTPVRPSGATYTFSTGDLSPIPSGWSMSIPAVDANHNPCYATSISCVSREDTYTIASSSNWSAPVKIVEDGEDGIGLTATTPIRYVSSSTTAPSKPQSNVKVTENRPITGTWTTALPALTNTYKYIYTCDMLEWDNGTVTYTDVVANNALSDLVTRVSAAELKITDDAIVATVRNSENYKADLSEKNATYTGSGIPTTSNYPASDWTTDALKQAHANDTYLTNSGNMYQYVQGSFGLKIRFSEQSETEQRYDYVRIYYQREGKTYVLPDISGTAISGATVFVPSPVFWIYFKSDSSMQKYGFSISSIEWVFNSWPIVTESTLPGITATDTSGATYPETNHPYSSNEERMWKYTTSNPTTPDIVYNWVLREDPSIRTLGERMSSAELKITDSAIISTVTSTTEGQSAIGSLIEQKADSIRLKADKIAWSSTNSSMTEAGILTCNGANINGVVTTTDSANGRTTKVQGGRINFYKTESSTDTLTGFISPFFWRTDVGGSYEGVTYLCTNNSYYLGIGRETSGAYESLIVVNNGLDLDGRYADVWFRGTVNFQTSGSISMSVTSNTTSNRTVSFGKTFHSPPKVLVTVNVGQSTTNPSAQIQVVVSNVTTSNCVISVYNPMSTTTVTAYWLAIE